MTMNRGIITISETGAVTMPTAPVWMMQFEIADLFGVFSCNVRKTIRVIYKNNELNEADSPPGSMPRRSRFAHNLRRP